MNYSYPSALNDDTTESLKNYYALCPKCGSVWAWWIAGCEQCNAIARIGTITTDNTNRIVVAGSYGNVESGGVAMSYHFPRNHGAHQRKHDRVVIGLVILAILLCIACAWLYATWERPPKPTPTWTPAPSKTPTARPTATRPDPTMTATPIPTLTATWTATRQAPTATRTLAPTFTATETPKPVHIWGKWAAPLVYDGGTQGRRIR